MWATTMEGNVKSALTFDRSTLRLFLGLAAAVFSLDLQIGQRMFIDTPVEFLAPLSLIALPFLWRRGPLVIVFLGCVAFSAFRAGTVLSGARYVALTFFGYFLLPYLLEKCPRKEVVLVKIFRAIGIALALWVLFNPWAPDGRYDLDHAYPFTGSKLSAGLVFSVAICVNLPWLVKPTGRLYCGVLMVIFGCTILLLESRAPLFSLALAVALFAWRRRTRILPAVAILGALLLITAEWAAQQQESELYQRVYARYVETDAFQSVSFQGRVMSWRNYLEASLSYPFGLGFEKSLLEFDAGRESWRDMLVAGAHSEFLKLLVELGWGPFLLLVFLNGKALVQCLRWKHEGREESLHLMLSMMFVALLPQLVVNNEMQHPEVSVLYWFTLGSLLAIGNPKRDKGKALQASAAAPHFGTRGDQLPQQRKRSGDVAGQKPNDRRPPLQHLRRRT